MRGDPPPCWFSGLGSDSIPIPLRFSGKQENMLICGFDGGVGGYLFSKIEIGDVFNAEFWFAYPATG